MLASSLLKNTIEYCKQKTDKTEFCILKYRKEKLNILNVPILSEKANVDLMLKRRQYPRCHVNRVLTFNRARNCRTFRCIIKMINHSGE